MWKRTLSRPLQALAVVLLAACVLSIAGLGLLAARGRSRLRLIRTRVEHSNQILQVALRAEQSLLAEGANSHDLDPDQAARLRREVADLASSDLALDPENTSRLQRLVEVLGSQDPISRDRLVQAVAVLNRVLHSETAAQTELWRQINEDASAELDLVLGFSAAVPVLALLVYAFGRRWFVKPLSDLGVLLNQLGSGERRQVECDGIHAVLAPLFVNYNRLVTRLDQLEEEHRCHAHELEQRIREATATLLEQQAALARAERLAAVGETAASLAHELRNPLAGILMSLGNLRSESTDPDVIDRLDAVSRELERLTRLLNDSLTAARHVPEPLRTVSLHKVVEELLTLVRYQVPAQLELVNAVPAELDCTVPVDRVRQALLNLVLNSVHAVGGEPGTVTVSAASIDHGLELIVTDDGPGFPSELLRGGIRAFASRSADGTGLGLAMVQRVAVDLGGEIHLDNLSPHGARVRLDLRCGHG